MTQKLPEDLSAQLEQVMKDSFFLKNYEKVIKSCFLNIVEDLANLKIIDGLKSNNNAEDVNFCFNVIFLFASHCLHLNLLATEVRTLLEEYTNNTEMIEDFIAKYTQFQEFALSQDSTLKETKLDSSINFNRLVDIEWKLLHTVSSKHLTKVSRDVYLINLKYVDLQGELKATTFKCSFEELSDLVENLNIAVDTISKTCDANDLISKQA